MRKLSHHTCRLMCLTLALLGLMSGATLVLEPVGLASAQVVGPSWSITGSLDTARYNHTATLLPNGKVLVAGGSGTGNVLLNSAELYDPANRTWSRTVNLNTTRYLHTATLLPSGKVLIAGGIIGGPPYNPVNSAELYDPATGTWSYTGNLNQSRFGHTATLLANGQVLIAGGWGGNSALNKAELYDPVIGTWSSIGNLNIARYDHTATLLENGKVLVTGGGYTGDYDYTLASTEIYDPVSGSWSVTSPLNKNREGHTATLLPSGQVLVAGGGGGYFESAANTSELYDPATKTWSNISYFFYTVMATLLPNGKILASRGSNPTSTELYDPATGMWGSSANLNTARVSYTATLLANGKVLVVGGSNGTGNTFNILNSAELFDLGLPQSGTVTSVSAASYGLMGLANETITTSFGTNLAAATQMATTIPLPTSLAGTTVKIKDSAGIERLAPLFFVSPTQVNYLIPPETTAGAATVTITSGDSAVSSGVTLVNAVAPSLFAANANGQGVAAAVALRVKADGSQIYEEVAQFDAAQNKFVARPLDPGPEGEQVYLLLFGSGMRHRSSLSAVIATIGGAYAEVSYAGAQPDAVGLDQVNVRLPRSLAGRGGVELLLTVDAQMANPVQLNIK